MFCMQGRYDNSKRGSGFTVHRDQPDTEHCVCGCGRKLEHKQQKQFRFRDQGWIHHACYAWFNRRGLLPANTCRNCGTELDRRQARLCDDCGSYSGPHSDRAQRRRYHFTRTYGIKASEAERIFAEQGGKCAICYAGITLFDGDSRDTAYFDHCHTNKRNRAFLCQPCNSGLGDFRDDPELLERAAAYLRLHQG
ncbi:endonuclease domain-containing protein [Nonomuraea muscovyensis]|uniref:endonuclease domain-containing protein n=1 Tax=Nonomuraea muscovyensis TaxID=1124761 RepID=UPI0035E3FF08